MNLSHLTLPVHDPPIAWRDGTLYGMPVVSVPSLPNIGAMPHGWIQERAWVLGKRP